MVVPAGLVQLAVQVQDGAQVAVAGHVLQGERGAFIADAAAGGRSLQYGAWLYENVSIFCAIFTFFSSSWSRICTSTHAHLTVTHLRHELHRPPVEGLGVLVPAGEPEGGGGVEGSRVVRRVQERRPQPRPHRLLHAVRFQQQLAWGWRGRGG